MGATRGGGAEIAPPGDGEEQATRRSRQARGRATLGATTMQEHQGWQRRVGSPARAPQPATPSDPGPPGPSRPIVKCPARPEYLSESGF